MGENSKIEWTDHTFNPWIGCQKVSPGCDHCYAEALSNRYGWTEWGPHGERKRTSVANWRKPRQWAKAANGTRPRVFCASLADVFDNQAPSKWRSDLFDLVAATPQLDWLLLTKRPENLARMFPTGKWQNVWLGTTCEDQERFDRRVGLLTEMSPQVKILFLSCEPLLSPITFPGRPIDIDWVIVGGESGAGARTMQADWARSIRDQCSERGIWFFMKQMTGKAEIPTDLMVREFPLSLQTAA